MYPVSDWSSFSLRTIMDIGAPKAMESVEAHCFIANSINARVTLTPEFVVASPPK